MDETQLSEMDPRSKKTYRFQMTALRSVITNLAKLSFPFFSRQRVEGADHVPNAGRLILAANHATNFDVFPIQFAVKRTIFFMAKAELFRTPASDFVYRQLGAFPVNRGERDDWAMRHAEKVLERELLLGMFPEGTRSKGNGLRTAKTGAARLAISMNCAILPVAIYGTHRVFKRFPQRTEIQVTIGELITPEFDETALNLTDRLMFTLAEMLPPEARGVYAHHPEGF